jgi:hypothetical protein
VEEGGEREIQFCLCVWWVVHIHTLERERAEERTRKKEEVDFNKQSNA